MIAEYDKYMDGDNFADIRRLHCNSIIMGLNHWWLKLNLTLKCIERSQNGLGITIQPLGVVYCCVVFGHQEVIPMIVLALHILMER